MVRRKGLAATYWRPPLVASQHSPCEAVGSGQDPLVVDEGATAEVAPAAVKADLPGPITRRGVGPAHDSAVERRYSAN